MRQGDFYFVPQNKVGDFKYSMKRIAALFILVSILFIMVTGCQAQSVPETITDDMGRSVTFNSAPQRIVSHVPAITEMLYALGLGDRVVGVSDYDDYPPEVKEKPSVGNYFNPSVENIVALNPDLVVTDGHSDTIQQLDNLHINYIVIDPQNMEGIIKDINLLGQVAGVEQKAQQVIDAMNSQLSYIESKIEGLPKIKIFYAVDMTDPNNPWTAGPGSMIDWMITAAGGSNVAANVSGDYVQYSIEQIVKDDPQIIIYPEVHGTEYITSDTFKDHPAWSKTTAVMQGNICSIDADMVSRFGPRITEGLLEMATLIHPEAFK